jgi:hypothetical protein
MTTEAQKVRAFNAKYPIGTPVTIGMVKTKTRSEAELLSGHTAIVFVEGHASCWSLDHVKVDAPVPAETK